MILVFFSSARMILLERHESLASLFGSIQSEYHIDSRIILPRYEGQRDDVQPKWYPNQKYHTYMYPSCLGKGEFLITYTRVVSYKGYTSPTPVKYRA
jgi:hypothetical protein